MTPPVPYDHPDYEPRARALGLGLSYVSPPRSQGPAYWRLRDARGAVWGVASNEELEALLSGRVVQMRMAA